MTPRAEELWSYLIGLGPVGSTVRADPAWLAEDLLITTRVFRSYLYAQLVKAGCIQKVSPHVSIVLKRIPALPDAPKPEPEPETPHVDNYARWKPSCDDIAARLAEIPADTRGLTGRVCGDPLPGRSAYDRRRAAL